MNQIVATSTPDFRRTAADLAGQLQLADRTAMTLASELQLAHDIILIMRSKMTLQQKIHLDLDLEARSISPDSTGRNRERIAVLSMAKQHVCSGYAVGIAGG